MFIRPQVIVVILVSSVILSVMLQKARKSQGKLGNWLRGRGENYVTEGSSRNQGETWNELRQLRWHAAWLRMRASIKPHSTEMEFLGIYPLVNVNRR